MRWGRPEGVDTPRSPRVHHVWVTLSRADSARDGAYPGLVVDWRRSGDGWEALVVYVTPVGQGSSHIVWIEAGKLTPVRDSADLAAPSSDGTPRHG